jgi:hypothetical protein
MRLLPWDSIIRLALRYKRRFANGGLANWGLADRSLAHLRLLVLRARQICSLPSEVLVTTRNFNTSILPTHEGQNLSRLVVCSTFPGN